MAAWIIAIIAVLACFFILPPLLDRVPRPKGGGMIGPALAQLNALFNPGERYVIEASRQLPAERENDEPKDPLGPDASPVTPPPSPEAVNERPE